MTVIRWRLKDLAAPERWNPRKLALSTGLSYQTVWAIWNNKAKRADLATLAALAAALDVAPGDLFAMDH
jgi:DNA-binding Xre family transcriptional regulator